jgi:hypothetical protein
MSAGRNVPKEKARKAVLDELERLSEDRHPRRSSNQTLLARFARCQDLQQTALSFARAVDAERRGRSATPLAPPPGWLPPLT